MTALGLYTRKSNYQGRWTNESQAICKGTVECEKYTVKKLSTLPKFETHLSKLPHIIHDISLMLVTPQIPIHPQSDKHTVGN